MKYILSREYLLEHGLEAQPHWVLQPNRPCYELPKEEYEALIETYGPRKLSPYVDSYHRKTDAPPAH